jgi:predicted glycoside hydrolase/deacetylase ChbG (UPF0249 family)
LSDEIQLCIMSDDFGMHPAVNEGIARAFTDGLLTDTNIMAPCPAFREAAAIARQIGLPTGFHATLTCDWDRYRWGPLTAAPSISASDGGFQTLVRTAWKKAKIEEVRAELHAQMDAIEAEDICSTHASYHMGMDRRGRFMQILSEIGPQRTGPMRIEKVDENLTLPAFRWQSIWCTSTWKIDFEKRKKRLLSTIRRLAPGCHMWMVHAAVDHPSLDELCSPDFPAWNWARPYRALDFALLMDSQVKELIEERSIRRIPVTAAPLG